MSAKKESGVGTSAEFINRTDNRNPNTRLPKVQLKELFLAMEIEVEILENLTSSFIDGSGIDKSKDAGWMTASLEQFKYVLESQKRALDCEAA